MMFQLYRRLKITDPESVTIKNTLRRLGYPLDEHRGVDRIDLFDVSAPDSILPSAQDCLVNQNKHYAMHVSGSGRCGDVEKFGRKYHAQVAVVTEDDPEAVSAFNVLRDRYGHGDEVESVEKRVIWGLTFSDGIDGDAARRMAEEMAKTFFANPAFQHYEIS